MEFCWFDPSLGLFCKTMKEENIMKIYERILRTIDGRLEKLQGVRTQYPNFYWPTKYKVVTQAFGINPQWYERFGLPGHEGIDMRAPLNSPIYAVWRGTVSRVGWYAAYGNHIRLSHTIGENIYESVYAHFERPTHWAVGMTVQRGQIIGDADSTGNSSGSHLHFSLKQFSGEKPNTFYQKAFDWPYNLIDCTMFFRELRHGYK